MLVLVDFLIRTIFEFEVKIVQIFITALILHKINFEGQKIVENFQILVGF